MENKIRDGDIYKVAVISDNRFTIRYGYGTDAEREKWEPTPIYPDFISEPVYTADGFPFATAFQDVCPHFKIKPDNNGESWCDNCIYFDKREDYIGICKCGERMLNAECRTQNLTIPTPLMNPNSPTNPQTKLVNTFATRAASSDSSGS